MPERGDQRAEQHDGVHGASAESSLPAVNSPIISMSIGLRDTLVPRAVMSRADTEGPDGEGQKRERHQGCQWCTDVQRHAHRRPPFYERLGFQTTHVGFKRPL